MFYRQGGKLFRQDIKSTQKQPIAEQMKTVHYEMLKQHERKAKHKIL